MGVYPVEKLVSGLNRERKEIPCDYYYDDYGSKLFDVLCYQKDYYLFRCEKEILSLRSAEILETTKSDCLVDLGCGTCEKTIEFLRGATTIKKVILVDINQFILNYAKALIESCFPKLEVICINDNYVDAMRKVRLIDARSKTIMFLGSNIGNMLDNEIVDLFSQINQHLNQKDGLIVGYDIDKDPRILETAYNDANGIAELTNRNVLSNLNNLYQADFRLDNFLHNASHFDKEKTVKSHLISLKKQEIMIKELGIHVKLDVGEPILTEIERKFDPSHIKDLFSETGFEQRERFTDSMEMFHVALFTKNSTN